MQQIFGKGMTKTDSSGSNNQSVLKDDKITSVIYTADSGYFFPEDYFHCM